MKTKRTIKISAKYIPITDKYIASISDNGVDYYEEAGNGNDLSEKIKELTGIEIDYDFNNRTFFIPKINRF